MAIEIEIIEGNRMKTIKMVKNIKYGDTEPIKWHPKAIKSEFDCYFCNNLKDLNGAPKVVNGSFYCSGSKNLEFLEGAPKKVNRNFDCSYCPKLTYPEIIKGLMNSDIKGNIITDYKNEDPKEDIELARKIGFDKWYKIWKLRKGD